MEADEEELAAEVRRVDQENILYVATATQFNQTYTIVEGLETRIEETKKDITEQERTTQEVTDTDEELEAKIQNHNKHKSTLEREGLRIKAALNEERSRLDEERENLNKTTRLLGQLQAEAKVGIFLPSHHTPSLTTSLLLEGSRGEDSSSRKSRSLSRR